jgi:uncharacterized protein YjbJ (UPF0337 family)
MDKDRVEGAAKQVKGSVKEAAGKVRGDSKTQAGLCFNMEQGVLPF